MYIDDFARSGRVFLGIDFTKSIQLGLWPIISSASKIEYPQPDPDSRNIGRAPDLQIKGFGLAQDGTLYEDTARKPCIYGSPMQHISGTCEGEAYEFTTAYFLKILPGESEFDRTTF